MGEPIYLLDANVFIEAARRYYAFDLAPKFWTALVAQAEKRRILSVDRVKHELEKGKDDLAKWAKEQFSNSFISTDEEDVIRHYSHVISWVNGQGQYFDLAKADFAKGADGWLIACAKAKNYVVVTHEILAPDAKRKVPIPNVCQALDVSYIDTFTMLRKLGVLFR